MPAAPAARRVPLRAKSTADAALYGIVADPVGHSVSPAMHNAAYRAERRNAVYLPLPAVDAADFMAFAEAFDFAGRERHGSVQGRPPAALRARRPGAEVGAVNTLARVDGDWRGLNTDVPGLAGAAGRRLALSALRATILGAGGAARGGRDRAGQCGRRGDGVRPPRPGRARRWPPRSVWLPRRCRRRRQLGSCWSTRRRRACIRASTRRRGRRALRRAPGVRPGLQPARDAPVARGACRRLRHARWPDDAGCAGRAPVQMVDRRRPAPGSCSMRLARDARLCRAVPDSVRAIMKLTTFEEFVDLAKRGTFVPVVQGDHRRPADAGVGVPQDRRALRLRVPARERRGRRARRPLLVPRQGSVSRPARARAARR